MNYEKIKKVKSMNTKTIAAVAIILAILGAGYALARPGNSNSWSGMMGGNRDGNGMMDYFGNGIWNGMMGGYRGMMGYDNGATAGYGGMMGGNWPGSGMMGYGNGNGHCGVGDGLPTAAMGQMPPP